MYTKLDLSRTMKTQNHKVVTTHCWVCKRGEQEFMNAKKRSEATTLLRDVDVLPATWVNCWTKTKSGMECSDRYGWWLTDEASRTQLMLQFSAIQSFVHNFISSTSRQCKGMSKQDVVDRKAPIHHCMLSILELCKNLSCTLLVLERKICAICIAQQYDFYSSKADSWQFMCSQYPTIA